MDDKKLQSILQDALEEEIPPSEIKLWPAVKASLVAGKKPFVQQGERMNNIGSRRLQRVALMVLMIAALGLIALITPPGRAFAENILQFFRRAESYERPLPPEQIPVTQDASAPTVMPPAPLMSMAEAEVLTGFDAKELPSDPQGFVFAGAMAGGGGISIQYESRGGGGALVINESTTGFMESEWDQAPAEYIRTVKVRGLNAEIVQGAYVVYPGETTAKWNSEASIVRLRWIEDGIWFEMAKFGNVESISYLDQAGLIALAESMVYKP
jgi:hypothetical protein